MDRTSLVFMVLLTAGSAADLHTDVTRAPPGAVTATTSNQSLLPTRQLLNTSETPDLQATPSTRVHANQETPSTHRVPQTTQRAAAPISFTPGATVRSAGMPTAVAPTSGATNPTEPPTAPPFMTNSTQTQGSSLSPTSLTPHQSTVLIQTFTPSTEPQRTPPSPGGGTTQISTSYKTTSAGKRPNPTESWKGPSSGGETSHGKVVAGLIGGALLVMMLGFLVIYMRKRRLQKQQITSTDWAGPSPFLAGGANDNQASLRSSNRISLSSFLPQRLSKRLSLLPEADEELLDVSPGGTFGRKPQGSTFGQEGDEKDGEESDRSPEAPPPTDVKDGKESNGTAAVPPTSANSGEAEGTEENSTP
ncbi:mucin-2-like [Cololabis saira]|uniref:mucin-2-like n=1 Tax=Cololabis saira TaxID=129043 RepID=UPI002AD30E9C|nr:mucin-2-like [Cololabis saira]